MKKILLVVLFTGCIGSAVGQTGGRIQAPPFEDKYSKLVGQLEDGKTDIDYRAFRESFLESKQFALAGQQSEAFDSLQKQMYALMGKDEYAALIKVCQAMLSINYTSMRAQKILYQTYKLAGDSANYHKYHDIELGLLKSIVKAGDGRTCATAWPVIDIEEEYFILEMLGARLIKQSIYTVDGLCDKMEVKEDGERKTYYFDIRKVFAGYEKAGLK